MSDTNNGVALPEAPEIPAVAEKPSPGRKPAKKTSFYDLCRSHCSKQKFSLKAKDADGQHTLSLDTLPVLTKEGVLQTAEAKGVKIVSKFHNPIDGKQASGSSSCDGGENASAVAEGFFAIDNASEEGKAGK
jgi:hypothetical protein